MCFWFFNNICVHSEKLFGLSNKAGRWALLNFVYDSGNGDGHKTCVSPFFTNTFSIYFRLNKFLKICGSKK